MIDETKIKRYFLRCRGCLSIMSIEVERPPGSMRCLACMGSIEIMGQVHFQRIVKMEDRTACDARCTMASGPNCDCQCQGKNHGSKITVTVAVDQGGIPRVTPANPLKAGAIHGEWLHAQAVTKGRILKFFPAYAKLGTGANLSAWETAQAKRAGKYMDQVLQAANLKTHHGRLAAIKKINDKMTEEAR